MARLRTAGHVILNYALDTCISPAEIARLGVYYSNVVLCKTHATYTADVNLMPNFMLNLSIKDTGRKEGGAGLFGVIPCSYVDSATEQCRRASYTLATEN